MAKMVFDPVHGFRSECFLLLADKTAGHKGHETLQSLRTVVEVSAKRGKLYAV